MENDNEIRGNLIEQLANKYITYNAIRSYNEIVKLIKNTSEELYNEIEDLCEEFITPNEATDVLILFLKTEGIQGLDGMSRQIDFSDSLFVKEQGLFNSVRKTDVERFRNNVIQRLSGMNKNFRVVWYINKIKDIQIPSQPPYDDVFVELYKLVGSYAREMNDGYILGYIFGSYVVTSDEIEEHLVDEIEYRGYGCIKDMIDHMDVTQRAFYKSDSGDLSTLVKQDAIEVKARILQYLEKVA